MMNQTPTELDKGLPVFLTSSRSVINYLAATDAENVYLQGRFQQDDRSDKDMQRLSTIYLSRYQGDTNPDIQVPEELWDDLKDLTFLISKSHPDRPIFLNIIGLSSNIFYYVDSEFNKNSDEFIANIFGIKDDSEGYYQSTIIDHIELYEASDDFRYFVYIEPFKDVRMTTMPLKHWNLRRAIQYQAGMDKSKVFNYMDTAYIPDASEEDYEDESEINPSNAIFIALEEEPKLEVPYLKHKRIKINGIEFKSSDLRLFYGSWLYNTLVNTGESNIVMPKFGVFWLRMLRDIFNGLDNLLNFYIRCPLYVYSILSGDRTLLDIFDLKVVRRLICSQFRFGIPLREQIADMDPQKYYLGEIGRLDELIEISKGE